MATAPVDASRMSPARRAVLLVTVAVLGGLGWWWLRPPTVEPSATTESNGPPPAITQPADASRLDPQVAALLRERAGAARAAPTDVEARAALALAFQANELWPEALTAWNATLALAPQAGEAWLWRYQRALVLRQNGDFQGALEALRAVTAQRPRFAPAFQRLGEALIKAGELDAASAAYETVVRLEPQLADGYVGRGEVALRRRAFQEAADALERATAIDPNDRAARYLLGQAYRGLDRLDEAAPLLAAAGAPRRMLADPMSERLAGDAVNLTAQLNRATAMMQQGAVGVAIEGLKKTLVAHPGNVRVMNNLAVAHLRAGQLQQAEQVLERAERRAPGDFATKLNWASFNLRSEDFEGALARADQAVAQAPDVGQAHMVRAMALDRLGRQEEALGAARTAQRLDARNPQGYLVIGRLAAQLEQHEEARDAFARAARGIEGPSALPAQIGLGNASLALGDVAAARRALAAARGLVPRHPEIDALASAIGEASP